MFNTPKIVGVSLFLSCCSNMHEALHSCDQNKENTNHYKWPFINSKFVHFFFIKLLFLKVLILMSFFRTYKHILLEKWVDFLISIDLNYKKILLIYSPWFHKEGALKIKISIFCTFPQRNLPEIFSIWIESNFHTNIIDDNQFNTVVYGAVKHT